MIPSELLGFYLAGIVFSFIILFGMGSINPEQPGASLLRTSLLAILWPLIILTLLFSLYS